MGSGMPMCEALAHVEQHRSVFDVVQIKYNDEVWSRIVQLPMKYLVLFWLVMISYRKFHFRCSAYLTSVHCQKGILQGHS
jgi:hypothetical protein